MHDNDNGNNYVRVTDVLTPFSGIDKAPQNLVENAAVRGTKVHKACEAIIKGLDAISENEEIKPYVDSFMLWWNKNIEVIAIEKRFFSNNHQLTGQVDLIVNDDSGMSIIDFKTSSKPNKTWPLQGSAYKHLATENGYKVNNIKFLHLNKTGAEPRMYIYEDQWDMFKKCLDVYNYFFRRKR